MSFYYHGFEFLECWIVDVYEVVLFMQRERLAEFIIVEFHTWFTEISGRLFFGGLSGVVGGVAGFMMTGDGSMLAVFWVWSYVMYSLAVSGSVCIVGGVASCSIQGVDWRAGVDVVVGRLAGAGWRGHSPAEGAGCLLLSALFLYLLVGSTLWKVSSTRTRSFPSDILQSGEPMKVYSFKAFIKTVGSMVIC